MKLIGTIDRRIKLSQVRLLTKWSQKASHYGTQIAPFPVYVERVKSREDLLAKFHVELVLMIGEKRLGCGPKVR